MHATRMKVGEETRPDRETMPLRPDRDHWQHDRNVAAKFADCQSFSLRALLSTVTQSDGSKPFEFVELFLRNLESNRTLNPSTLRGPLNAYELELMLVPSSSFRAPIEDHFSRQFHC